MQRIKSLFPAWSVFFLAMLVRVLYNVTVARNYTPQHDSLFYQTIGLNLVSEHCFCLHPYIATVYRAPLWPFMLSGLSIFFGSNDFVARMLLSLLDSGTCVLVYLFAQDLFGRRIGLLAGLFAAIYPEMFIYTGWLYTETLYTFFLFALCYTLLRLMRKEGGAWSLWLISGILLGLLSLTRPNGIIVIALVVVWAIIMIWLKLLRRRVTLMGIVLTSLLACILIAPWTIRNYQVSHSFIPVATGDGTVLLGAYNSMSLTRSAYPNGFPGTWINPLVAVPKVAYTFPLIDCKPPCEVAREDTFKNAAYQWISSHLDYMPRLLLFHFLNLWVPDTHEADLPVDRFPGQTSSKIVLFMMKTFPILLFVLAAIGLVAQIKRWRELLFIYFMILLTIAQALYFYGSPRFRAPIEPMLIVLAAGAIAWLISPGNLLRRWFIIKSAHTEPLQACHPSLPSCHPERSEGSRAQIESGIATGDPSLRSG
ncbi:MAG TPA: glycosyltransferase family 39 protein [Ktedonobacteraceae bacterium]|jgi:4-amino-4-deoxy-L-arabinose transferase-like glycosyltransferase|nr:glycosyltransferase family 39 protein [Ktedonobacteraceae bacterium]